MDPARPTPMREIARGVNAEREIPPQVRMHAHESSEATEPARRATIEGHLRESDLVVVTHVLLDEEVMHLEQLIRTSVRSNSTVIVTSAAAPLMRLTRVGKFRMGGRRN